MGKIRVGILGATGTVGQRFLQLLERHPRFSVTALAASDRSQGKPYAAACAWRLPGAVPDAVRDLVVQAPEPPLDCDVVFSSLPSDVAGSVETRFARAGYRVVTNSSPHRMDDAVPLLIPEVNPDQLALLDACKATGGGFIVANPNCSTVMIALALAPLADRFGVAAVVVTTLQAISGAGYPGVASLDITDNVVPFIPEEEEKIERETRKILGSLEAGRVTPARFAVSAQCHRVNVVDGHMAAVRVKLDRAAEPAELREAFASFTGVPQELRLPSAPERPILVRDEPDRPQPRLDRDAGGGMSISVGRIARDGVLGHRFIALSHNTIRGAAGAAILNAELLLAKGYLAPRFVVFTLPGALPGTPLTPATYPPSNRRHHHSALYSNRRRIVACVACLGGSGASPPAPLPSQCSPRVPRIPPRRLRIPFSPSPRPTPSLKSSRPMRPRSSVGRRSMPRPACRSPRPPCPGRRRWLRRPRAARPPGARPRRPTPTGIRCPIRCASTSPAARSAATRTPSR